MVPYLAVFCSRPKTALRIILLAASAAICGLIAAAFLRGPEMSPQTAGIEPSDGRKIRGVRYGRYDGDTKVLSVTVDEARVSRARLGVFRIGFAEYLTARNARVDLLVGTGPLGTEEGLATALASITEPGRSNQSRIVAVHVQGIVLRLRSPAGDWVEISANKCEAGALNQGRIVFSGDVRVRSEKTDLAFEKLTYGTRAKEFVAGNGGHHRGSAHDDKAKPAPPLEAANDAMRRVVEADPQHHRYGPEP